MKHLVKDFQPTLLSHYSPVLDVASECVDQALKNVHINQIQAFSTQAYLSNECVEDQRMSSQPVTGISLADVLTGVPRESAPCIISGEEIGQMIELIKDLERGRELTWLELTLARVAPRAGDETPLKGYCLLGLDRVRKLQPQSPEGINYQKKYGLTSPRPDAKDELTLFFGTIWALLDKTEQIMIIADYNELIGGMLSNVFLPGGSMSKPGFWKIRSHMTRPLGPSQHEIPRS